MARSTLLVTDERWSLRESFTISRGSKSEAHVVVATIDDGAARGWGECVPYPHYGETVDGVMAQIAALSPAIARGMGRQELLAALPAGAARNALDCALWDLECQRSGVPVWRACGLAEPKALTTSYTLAIADAAVNADAASERADWPLKIKLGRDDDLARAAAIRGAAPNATLFADVNEGWSVAQYQERAPALGALGVSLLEQPLPPAQDALLASLPRPIPLCADESCRHASLASLADRYAVVNLKLDRLGGLTAALAAASEARALGLEIMVGCMCATSLSMAPAMLLASGARYVDLDAGLLLARDRPDGVVYHGPHMSPSPRLWGIPRATATS